MQSIITHFYNEEYLLPWWLEHHKKYFNYGVLIDYGSTDNSVAICKEICPHWQVFPSANEYFDCHAADQEVMFYERQLPGWRIALNVTEFLVGPLERLMSNPNERVQYIIPEVMFTGWNPKGVLDQNKPLWEQITFGVPYTVPMLARLSRSLHNFNDIQYQPGRHFDPWSCDEALIFHYGHAIVSDPMLKRRLQVQDKISPADKQTNLGWQHHFANQGLTKKRLKHLTKGHYYMGAVDCTDMIKRVTTAE